MNVYSIALFLHIVGALGLSAALGVEWLGLRQIRKAASPEQVRAWMGILKGTNKAGFPSMLATVITGVYMMLKVWGGASWLIVTIGSLVLVIALALVLSKPRMVAIGRSLAMERGSLSPTFHQLVNNPILWMSIQTRVVMVLGIVFLKIAMPDLGGSLLTMGLAIVLGIVSALPLFRRVREQGALVG